MFPGKLIILSFFFFSFRDKNIVLLYNELSLISFYIGLCHWLIKHFNFWDGKDIFKSYSNFADRPSGTVVW